MRKYLKGQLSIFIVLGIIALFLAGVAFFVSSTSVDENLKPGDASSVKYFVGNCLNRVGSKGLYLIGQNGGYANLNDSEKIFASKRFATAYAFDRNVYLPSKLDISRNLARYIDNNLIKCVDDFKEFKKLGFDVDYKMPITDVLFGVNNVIINTDFPVTISKDRVVSVSKYSSNLNVRFSTLYDSISEILLGPLPYIDLTYLGSIDVDTYVLNFNDTQVYQFIDFKSRLLNNPYMFMFAIKKNEE